MAQYEHLPIYKKAFDLSVSIEKMVKNFTRYHKYTLGAELRNVSREVIKLVIRANSEKDKLSTLVCLRDTIEELKLVIRLCKEAEALKSFNVFKNMMSDVINIGKQSEGWIKSISGRK